MPTVAAPQRSTPSASRPAATDCNAPSNILATAAALAGAVKPTAPPALTTETQVSSSSRRRD